MRKQIAAAVIISLITSSPVWAQDDGSSAWKGYDRRSDNLTPSDPGPCLPPSDYTETMWRNTSLGYRKIVCAEAERRQSIAAAQQYQSQYPQQDDDEGRLSPKLASVGFLTALVGTGFLYHSGTTYRVLGEAYCVDDYSVDYGACHRTATEKKIGLYMIAGGVGAVIIGMHKVTVSPMITPQVKGVTGTVQWGGKK